MVGLVKRTVLGDGLLDMVNKIMMNIREFGVLRHEFLGNSVKVILAMTEVLDQRRIFFIVNFELNIGAG